jgi:phage/plasmid primase-like uncharacterized protein
MIEASDIERAKATPIESEISRRGYNLKHHGPELVGPCPVCGGTDRFAIHIRKQCWHCRGCQKGGDVISLVQHLDGIEFPAAIEVLTGDVMRKNSAENADKSRTVIVRSRDDQAYEARQLHLAESIWRAAIPALPQIAYLHFFNRKIDMGAVSDEAGLRFHGDCPWDDGTTPCIIGRYTTAIGNEPRGIWRRPIDGRKPKSLGSSKGCVIRLWPDEDITTGLVIGEGVETTLAAATRCQYGPTLLQPAWATGSAGNMEHFPVLPGIECLTILVDNDASGTGQRAAEACAQAWLAAGKEVVRILPNEVGLDFNDLIIRGVSK